MKHSSSALPASSNPLRNLLLTTVTSLTFSGPATAAVFSLQFSPVLAGGSDPNGLVGSTWVMEFQVSQTTYQALGIFGDIGFTSDSAELTIFGAGNAAINGVHAISSNGPGGDFVFIPDFFGTTQIILEGPSNTGSTFSFAGLTVSNFGPAATPAIASPTVGSPVNLAPFNAASFTSGSNFQVNGSSFSLVSSPIPEPSSVLMLLTLPVWLGSRRRRIL